ncbi:hypothetical protein POKO110462_03135 [Pontibacter korlensis]|uniref:Late embryogenesis abundant protein LEA-2 subgroup domain-containing protein n=1 Tax=Pontibacter korlensis TaxID=400092 RepID=A0A0E3UX29_9BACT|nr:hypothetical protein [Pontibacter korlensis]AKD03887.1 hypothetical protein PKOR_13160 [Pontibacter korlensis]
MTKKAGNYALLLMLLVLSFACKTKNDVDAFKEAKYDLQSIDRMELNGIDLLKKKRPQDFSFNDAAVLYSAFADNALNAVSTIGLKVDLPEGSENRTMTVTKLKWQLLVNDEHTLNGLVSEPVELRDGVNNITISSPLSFATESGGQPDLNKLLRLATLLNKDSADRPKVTLQIKPTIQTSVGPFELPTFINIKQ